MRRRALVPRLLFLVVASCAIFAMATTIRMPAVWAASPAPTEEIVGDTRSSGEGPGLVGAPFLAIGGVLVLGLAAAGLTIVYVRATGGPGPETSSRFGPRGQQGGRPDRAERRR